MLKENLRDYGLSLKTAFVGWTTYAFMAVCMAPIVWMVSYDSAFLKKYPFFPLAPGEPIPAAFFRWELHYAAQFLALEFLFRGYMVHGLKHRFGAAAIMMMTLPYCMIHFGKPLLETMASIGAGLILGGLSLKTRSIWLGAALHVYVAWLMDALALYRKGFL